MLDLMPSYAVQSAPPAARTPAASTVKTRPRLIAFAGLAGSGKSTAARYLVETHGFVRVRFAGPLKDMMRVLGLNEWEIEGDLKETPCAKLGGKTPRFAMQRLGTEFGREMISETLWTDAWITRANDAMAEGSSVVVDDCRFVNEAAAIWLLGGTVVNINGRGGLAGSHASEGQPILCDEVIPNNGSVADLLTRVSELVA